MISQPAGTTMEAAPTKPPLLVIKPAALEPKTNADGLSSEQRESHQRMMSLKVSPEVARELLQSTSSEALRLQLDYLNDRDPRNRAATFVKAVREGREATPKYFKRREAVEGALRAKTHKGEAKEAHKAAQEAAKRQETARAQQESAQLDAMWERLDATTRQRIEAQAKERLGVIGQSGGAGGALAAMRRNLLRERLAKTDT